MPVGTCQFDNSAGAYVTTGFKGQIIGNGKSSSLAFSTLANDGLDFNSASGMAIKGMTLGYGPAATTRGGGYPVNIDSSSYVIVADNVFTNGNLSALRVGNSNFAQMLRNTITGFLANGIFTVNNNDLKFFGTTCSNSGDSCEEYSYYDSATQHSCSKIFSSGLTSTNDLNAIRINGCTEVTIPDYTGIGGAHECIWIGQDSTTTTTHFADNVSIGPGTCRDTGYGTNPLNRNTAQAIIISYDGTPPTPVNISIAGGIMKHTAGRALQLGDNDTTNLSVDGLMIDDAGNGNTSATGECIYLDGNIVTLNGVRAANCGTYSLRNHLGTYVKADGFISVNPNKLGAAANGILNEVNGGYFVLNGPTMLDNWAGANRSGISNLASSGVQKTFNYTSLCTVTCTIPGF